MPPGEHPLRQSLLPAVSILKLADPSVFNGGPAGLAPSLLPEMFRLPFGCFLISPGRKPSPAPT